MSDPFEDAASNGAGNTSTAVDDTPAESTQDRADDRLFGGELLPSIFTKKHDVGDWVEFVIKDLPFEKQSRFFAEGEAGELKFWGEDGKPTRERKGSDGKPLKPVMDLVIPLSTTYRFTPEQLESRGQDSDDGTRGWYLSGGNAEKEFKAAVRRAGIRSSRELVGVKGKAKRTGKVKRGEYSSWTYAVELTRG